MAGAFAHIAMGNSATRHPAIAEPTLKKLLNRYAELLWLGAVSPNLPYLSLRS